MSCVKIKKRKLLIESNCDMCNSKTNFRITMILTVKVTARDFRHQIPFD